MLETEQAFFFLIETKKFEKALKNIFVIKKNSFFKSRCHQPEGKE